MDKNVGTLDAYIRISMGLMMVGSGIIYKSFPKVAIGSCKVAEGVTRFCPMLYVMGINTRNIQLKKSKKYSSSRSLFSGL